MPISVIVGGQFGSEGKGKVSLDTARDRSARYVVRVGGTNSGHTGIDLAGRAWALRQLPAAILAPNSIAVLPAGALIDANILAREISELGLATDRVVISPHASVIEPQDILEEQFSEMSDRIGSTCSGTGAALIRRMRRHEGTMLAGDHPALKPYVKDTTELMVRSLDAGEWIVVEGTQGFGLSLLHGGYFPNATSRDTTAASFVGEAGLSPLDVQDIALVIRALPIRVAGRSGPLPNETTWNAVAARAGLPIGYKEWTTATRKIRRVAEFDPEIVKRAITVNRPTRIVLNHFDYLSPEIKYGHFSKEVCGLLEVMETSIGRRVSAVGIGPGQEQTKDRAEVRASKPLKMRIPA